MKKLYIFGNINRVHDAIAAAYPERIQEFVVEGTEPGQEGYYITFPDDISEATIDDIVANHDPTPPEPPPTMDERLLLLEELEIERQLGGEL